ncbi:RNA-binding protein, partial [Streptomyces griseus]|nr:RNA-binding protein [Streptomyces griseus]
SEGRGGGWECGGGGRGGGGAGGGEGGEWLFGGDGGDRGVRKGYRRARRGV